MPKTKNKLINLLPSEEFEGSIMGRILKWTMTTFRIIVIVTELAVMAAFLSRFWLDAQNSDITESLNIKSAQIETQKEFENEFRSLQKVLGITSSLSKEQKASTLIDKVVSKIPSDVSLRTISIQEKMVQVKGISPGEAGIAQFVSNLKSEEAFKAVTLGQLNSSENNQLATVFTINITY